MSTSVLLGILIPFYIRQDLLKHVEMGNQWVDDLWVTWAGDAVFSYVGRPGNPGTKVLTSRCNVGHQNLLRTLSNVCL